MMVVGTPIGNLGDMSPRAVEALRSCDFIAAEDTRVTMKLLNHFQIKKPLVSYYEHNKLERGEMICGRIEAGESCCIVTDAGMPCISDPGELLVAQCHERNIPVEVVPGPSAVISALAVSGMSTGRFTFEGFLSMAKKSRREHLEELKEEKRTMVFYEAPHKLLSTLKDMAEAFGKERPVALVKELTKLHERVVRTTLGEAAEYFVQEPPKGEFVLILEGKKEEKRGERSLEGAVSLARELSGGGMSLSEAARTAAQRSGFRKGEIYKALLEDNGEEKP